MSLILIIGFIINIALDVYFFYVQSKLINKLNSKILNTSKEESSEDIIRNNLNKRLNDLLHTR